MKNTKIAQAQTIARMKLAKVATSDNQGRALSVIVPGSEAKQYRVTLARSAGSIAVSCHNLTENAPCLGNAMGLCYHSLTAVLVANQARGNSVHVSTTEANARKKGGQVVFVKSGDTVSTSGVWLAVKKGKGR